MVDLQSLRDTQINWIGHIPAHWSLKKIKYVFWERKENNNPIQTENLISLTIEKGVIPHSEKTGGGNKPKEDLTKYKIVRPGDIVLNSMNVIAGAVGISKYFGIVSPVYYMLIPVDQGSTKEYFHHLFRTELFQKSLYGLGNGILIKENEETGKLNTIRMRIPMDKLGDQLIPVPPLNEQKLISRYLDEKTSQIDSLINKIEKKIELLKEQRISLINQCVTKGLRSDVEMVDSGIESIGYFPKHWKLSKYKYEVTIQNGYPFKSELFDGDSGFPLIRIRDVTSGIIETFYTGEPLAEFTVKKDDLLVGMDGDFNTRWWTGPDALLNQRVCRIFEGESLDRRYISYILPFQLKVINDLTYFTTVKHLSSFDVLETKTLVPPIDEQRSIIKFLDENTGKIDKSISLESQKIMLLKEYRQSLIYSGVTGKVRVTKEMI